VFTLPVTPGTVEAERFGRLFREIGGLDHARVVQVFDSGTAGDLPFYTLPCGARSR